MNRKTWHTKWAGCSKSSDEKKFISMKANTENEERSQINNSIPKGTRKIRTKLAEKRKE